MEVLRAEGLHCRSEVMSEIRIGTEIADRYVVDAVIGTGGFGTVWKATDRQLERPVALKRLLTAFSTDESSELLTEARLSSHLTHQNIVQVFDILQHADDQILVMEFVDGSSLWSILRQNAIDGLEVSLEKVYEILRGILHGISYAHSNNICHRDLSPMNILVAADGTAKIADFGIARSMGEAESRSDATPQAGTGNPSFMAPEQAEGEPADQSSDLFKIGILGYVLLTGRHPFLHPSGLFEIRELLCDRDYDPPKPKPPPQLSASEKSLFREYAAVVERLLRRERSSRFESAVGAIEALESAAPSNECQTCGERMPEAHSFCGHCGAAFREPNEEASALSVDADTPAQDVERLAFQAGLDQRWRYSIDLYQEAIRRDRRLQRAYAGLGYSLNHLGQYEEAIAVLSDGLSLPIARPEYKSNFLYMRAFALGHLKQYEDSLADIMEALEIDPESVRSLYQRALVLDALGRRAEAREDMNHVLRLQPHERAMQTLMRWDAEEGIGTPEPF